MNLLTLKHYKSQGFTNQTLQPHAYMHKDKHIKN